jgi:hypothetical protein
VFLEIRYMFLGANEENHVSWNKDSSNSLKGDEQYEDGFV